MSDRPLDQFYGTTICALLQAEVANMRDAGHRQVTDEMCFNVIEAYHLLMTLKDSMSFGEVRKATELLRDQGLKVNLTPHNGIVTVKVDEVEDSDLEPARFYLETAKMIHRFKNTMLEEMSRGKRELKHA